MKFKNSGNLSIKSQVVRTSHGSFEIRVEISAFRSFEANTRNSEGPQAMAFPDFMVAESLPGVPSLVQRLCNGGSLIAMPLRLRPCCYSQSAIFGPQRHRHLRGRLLNECVSGMQGSWSAFIVLPDSTRVPGFL